VTKQIADFDELGPLSGFAPELAGMFVSLAGDIALVVGQDGVIQNVAHGAAIAEPAVGNWIGRPWAETVTGDTRRKIELLLQEVDEAGVTRRREVSHPSHVGGDIPISYSAVRLGKQGPVIAVGRDLRAVAAIQQQLVNVQQDMERDYWTLRRDQTQQRELHQVASDAVMVVTGPELQIFMANQIAKQQLFVADEQLAEPVRALLALAVQSGRAMELRARLKSQGLENQLFDIFVTPFGGCGPSDGGYRLLVRARQVASKDAPLAHARTAITDTQGRVLMASDALLALCAEHGCNSLYGQSLSTVLDSAQGVIAGLIGQVKRDGMAHAASAVLGGQGGAVCEAEIFASLINDGDQERIGLLLHVQGASTPDSLAAAIQAMMALPYKQPLGSLLKQVQTLAERHAVMEVLRSTGANMAVSAKLLGISIPDLAARLARLGLDRAQYTAH
jgi:hypothetical protein